MNHPSQFARSITPRVAAKAADARPSLLPASAATSIDHRQHGSTHERGRGVPELGMLSRASIPADGRRVQSGFGHCVKFSNSLNTCRGLCGSGPFPFGNQPRRQAIADLPEPIHSKISVPFAHEHEAKGVGSDQEAIGVYQNVDC